MVLTTEQWEQRLRACEAAVEVQTSTPEIIIDINVYVEIYSFADLFRTANSVGSPELVRLSRAYRYRCLRVRHSLILAFILAKRGIRVGIAGLEATSVLVNRLSSREDADCYRLTKTFVHKIAPVVLKGWHAMPILGADLMATAAEADKELCAAAQRFSIPLITNEGSTKDGIVAGKRSLRTIAKANSVDVYTPKEFLGHLKVNVGAEVDAFLTECAFAVGYGDERPLMTDIAATTLMDLYTEVMLDVPVVPGTGAITWPFRLR